MKLIVRAMRGVRATVMAALLKAREPHDVMISDLVKIRSALPQ